VSSLKEFEMAIKSIETNDQLEFQQSSLFEAADEDDAEQMRSKRRYSKSQSD